MRKSSDFIVEDLKRTILKLQDEIRYSKSRLNLPEPDTYEQLEDFKERTEEYLAKLDSYQICPECDGTGGGLPETVEYNNRFIDIDHSCKNCDGRGFVE